MPSVGANETALSMMLALEKAANLNASQPPIESMAAQHQPAPSQVLAGGECGNLSELELADSQYDEHLYVSLSTFWYCFLAFITTIGLLVSLVSNMIIIYLFTKTPSLRRNPSNIIAVNLSLSDLLYCTQWPSVIYCSLTQSTWMLEINFLCQTFGFLTVSTALASILTVLAMSIERAIVIGYSIHAKSHFTIRGAWLIVVLIWIMSICSCLPPLFGKFNRYTLDPSKTSCTLDYLSSKANHKLYILVLYIAYWIVPAIIITICYVTIIVTFKRSSASLKLIAQAVPERRARNQPTCDGSTPLPANKSATRRLRCQPLRCDDRVSCSQPSSLQNSPGDFRSVRRGRLFDFKLANRRLRDSIRLNNLVGSHHRRQPAEGNQLAAAPNRAVWMSETSGSCDCQAVRVARSLESADAASSQLQSPTPPPPDDVERVAGIARLRPCSAAFCGRISAAPAVLEMRRHLDSSRAQVTAATELTQTRCNNGRRRGIGMARSRTSQELRVPRRATSRLSDATACVPLNQRDQPPNALNRTTSNLRLHKFTNMFANFVTGHEQRSESQLQSQQPAGSAWPALGPGQQRQLSSLPGESSCHVGGSGAHLSRTSLQIRLAKMAFYLILLWFVSWTPIASLAMINSVVRCQHRASALAVFTANTMTKLGPAFDVFIYGISHPKIKSKFKEIIKWLLMIGRHNQLLANHRQATLEQSKRISVRSNMNRAGDLTRL